MGNYNIESDQKYICYKCDKEFELQDAEANIWKCPKCGEYISIEAPNIDGGIILNRKQIDDLNINDYMVFPGGRYIYRVLQITDSKKICLEGYGPLDDDFEYYDIVVGSL